MPAERKPRLMNKPDSQKKLKNLSTRREMKFIKTRKTPKKTLDLDVKPTARGKKTLIKHLHTSSLVMVISMRTSLTLTTILEVWLQRINLYKATGWAWSPSLMKIEVSAKFKWKVL